MTALIHRLTTTTFDQLAKSTEFLLVEVDGADPKDKVIGELASYFDVEYPQRFIFGKLNSKIVTVDVWWTKRFPTPAFGTLSGIHLFLRGKHVWCHSGYVAPENHDIVLGLIGAFLAPNESLDAFTRKRVNAVANALEAHLKKLETSSAELETESSANTSNDPYSVLGVARSASNDEVRQAFKNKMAGNHPDKLAHLDSEFQVIAEARVRKIQAAYDAIKKERRLA